MLNGLKCLFIFLGEYGELFLEGIGYIWMWRLLVWEVRLFRFILVVVLLFNEFVEFFVNFIYLFMLEFFI